MSRGKKGDKEKERSGDRGEEEGWGKVESVWEGREGEVNKGVVSINFYPFLSLRRSG